ncbi:MAG: hypothetical protein ACRBCI_11030 [Cellvibrionaceae bacterium]
MRYTIFFLFTILLLSCDKSSLENYGALCNIYEEALQKEADKDEKNLYIYDSIEKMLPAFFKEDYPQIINTDRDKKYSFTQKIIYLKTNKELNWECEAMKQYYEG